MQAFKTLLAATDLVTVPDPVVVTAFKIAIHHRARLNILHIIESSSGRDRAKVKSFQNGSEIVAVDNDRQAVRREIRHTYKRFLRLYDAVDIWVDIGFPWRQVVAHARQQEADLILLGPHANRADRSGAIDVKGKVGSTVEGVIRCEPCPTWIVNRVISARMVRLSRILAAVDFSESCRTALQYAAELARICNGRLVVFHMHGVPPSPRYGQAKYEEDLRRCSARLEAFCDELTTGTVHEYRVWGGTHPHLEIARCADNVAADLIAMGSHTRSRERKWYVGSAVERLSRRAACPVAVVTDPGVLAAEGQRVVNADR